jgi:Glycosyltransferase WbsX
MQFEPSLGALPEFADDAPSWSKLRRNIRHGVWGRKLKLYDYREVRSLIASTRSPRSNVPCIFVSWDNCARRGENGIIFTGCSPDAFEAELKSELTRWQKMPKDTDLFFISGWNEWAEGNCLEPNTRFGRGYLEAVRRCFEPFYRG